ncbi:MAG TPA: transaminase [Solirubrobacteraceae bacterium]
MSTAIDGTRLGTLLERELERFQVENPRSRELFERARGSLVGGVPMPWMMLWAGGFPVFAETAAGARITDVDGHEYIDFALGDTGAMAGHSPGPTAAAVALQAARGITTMLPSEDAIWVAEELSRRFGMARWLYTLTATDANRAALRLCRQITGRPKVLVYSYCYHGSVDESFAVGEGGRTVARAGNVGAPVDVAETTVAIEFNNVAALEAALATGEIAVVLAEPAMTNMGIILPGEGYMDALRELTRAAGTLLIIDETHTFSAGPGGCTQAWRLDPDVLVIGKAIGGGVPCGALGLSEAVLERMFADADADYEDTGGIGGTLAGNPLSSAAMRATLEHTLHADAFAHTIPLATRFATGVQGVIDEHRLPWNITQLGCRAEYQFLPEPARDGTTAFHSHDEALERYLHLHAQNRGVLLTPFHNMALMAPTTSAADVDRHTEVFQEAVAGLVTSP